MTVNAIVEKLAKTKTPVAAQVFIGDKPEKAPKEKKAKSEKVSKEAKLLTYSADQLRESITRHKERKASYEAMVVRSDKKIAEREARLKQLGN